MFSDDHSKALHDPARLAELHRTGLVDGPAEPSFDRLTRLASRLLRAPVALVSLVDVDRQFFASCLGLPEPWASRRQTPLTHSFCRDLIAVHEPLVIADARADAHFRDNPAIVELGVVAYLGIPLVSRGGHVLGSLCAIDEVPRQWTEDEIELLGDLAASVETEIELRSVDGERRRIEEALRASEARFRTLADSMPQIVWSARPDGSIDYFNRRWYEYSGLPEGVVGDEGWLPIFEPEDGRSCADGWYAAVRSGEPYQAEYPLKDLRNGGSRWHLIRGVPVRDDSGRIVRWFGTSTDVDDQKRSAEERTSLLAREQEARREAEAATLAKDRFLAMLSHELRTPLTPVLLLATAMLRDPATPPELRPTFEDVRRAVELEVRMIDDLLDVSRIINGKLAYRFEVVDVHDLARRTLEMCRDEAAEKGIALVAELEAAEHRVSADPARLLQVLCNLVKNGVKFTPAGGSVRVRTRDLDSRLRVEVVDTGMGIDDRAMDRVFNAFEQVEDAVTRRFGGLGLGLAISRSVAEAHGGRLTVASQGKGRGSTFTLELATARPEDLEAARAPEPDSTATPARRAFHVLLVEDDAMTARVMGRLLRQSGHRVTAANTIARALEGPIEEYDIVVSDLGLPDGSGLDLLRRIRERRDVPGIALTGYGTEADVQKGIEAGFAAYLTKPLDFNRLEAAIQQVGSATRSDPSRA